MNKIIKIYIIMIITLTLVRYISSFEHMVTCSLAMIISLLIKIINDKN